MNTTCLQFMRPGDRFKTTVDYGPVLSPANGNEPAGSFWPEVSSRHALQNPANPENSPQRILFEVFLVLAAGALAVAAAIVWGPTLS